MQERVERTRLAILRILGEAGGPISSENITAKLEGLGYVISERTVRFHLLAMDSDGLTESVNKQGRRITPRGLTELNSARVYDRLGFLTAKINQMTYEMTFNLEKMEGTLVVNVSLLKAELAEKAFPLMRRVYEAGLAMGRLAALFGPGERIGDMTIPDRHIGIGTVCSITLNGILLKEQIPTVSRFGGLMEVRDRKPTRFVALISYDGTTLDPLEIFIKSGMTDYLGATGNGNGLIGASFREVPSNAVEEIQEIIRRLEPIGLNGFHTVGAPDQPLFEIPVSAGCAGVVVIGGLNPVAILEESGFDPDSKALCGFVDFKRLFPYTELEERFRRL